MAKSVGKEINVSVIIPTYNAGADFRFLLGSLWDQKEIDNLEIVVVDSGSNDGTVEMARECGANVIEIPHVKFSHSYSRNLGAEKACGDYILFMVQDALPENEFWVRNMVEPISDGVNISAVTCVEYPREDADLFARIAISNQIQWLDVKKKNRIMSLPEEIPESQTYEYVIRQNGCLNDVACAYRRNIFMQYKYRLDYAEDLDMGKRLIEDGHRLMLLGMTVVRHSHNRSAMYYLRRMLVERKVFGEILDDYEKVILTENEFLLGSVWLYDKVMSWISEITRLPLLWSKFAILDAIKGVLSLDGGFLRVRKLKIQPERELTELVNEIRGCAESIDPSDYSAAKEKIYTYYKGKVDGMIGFLWNNNSEAVTLEELIEICEAMYSFYGNTIGMLWGDLENKTSKTQRLQEIFENLSKGI